MDWSAAHKVAYRDRERNLGHSGDWEYIPPNDDPDVVERRKKRQVAEANGNIGPASMPL